VQLAKTDRRENGKHKTKEEQLHYQYTTKSLVNVSTTNIYLEYVGYMFRPVNKSSSGHQSNKSNLLLRYWDSNIYNYIQYKIWY